MQIEIEQVQMQHDGGAIVRARTRFGTTEVHFPPAQVKQLAELIVQTMARSAEGR